MMAEVDEDGSGACAHTHARAPPCACEAETVNAGQIDFDEFLGMMLKKMSDDVSDAPLLLSVAQLGVCGLRVVC